MSSIPIVWRESSPARISIRSVFSDYVHTNSIQDHFSSSVAVNFSHLKTHILLDIAHFQLQRLVTQGVRNLELSLLP